MALTIGRAMISTGGGKRKPRPSDDAPPTILRPQFKAALERQAKIFADYARRDAPEHCAHIYPPVEMKDLGDHFDDYDIRHQGAVFLLSVVNLMARENAWEVGKFMGSYTRKYSHPDHRHVFHTIYLEDERNVENIFSSDLLERYSKRFLQQAAHQMKIALIDVHNFQVEEGIVKGPKHPGLVGLSEDQSNVATTTLTELSTKPSEEVCPDASAEAPKINITSPKPSSALEQQSSQNEHIVANISAPTKFKSEKATAIRQLIEQNQPDVQPQGAPVSQSIEKSPSQVPQALSPHTHSQVPIPHMQASPHMKALRPQLQPSPQIQARPPNIQPQQHMMSPHQSPFSQQIPPVIMPHDRPGSARHASGMSFGQMSSQGPSLIPQGPTFFHPGSNFGQPGGYPQQPLMDPTAASFMPNQQFMNVYGYQGAQMVMQAPSASSPMAQGQLPFPVQLGSFPSEAFAPFVPQYIQEGPPNMGNMHQAQHLPNNRPRRGSMRNNHGGQRSGFYQEQPMPMQQYNQPQQRVHSYGTRPGAGNRHGSVGHFSGRGGRRSSMRGIYAAPTVPPPQRREPHSTSETEPFPPFQSQDELDKDLCRPDHIGENREDVQEIWVHGINVTHLSPQQIANDLQIMVETRLAVPTGGIRVLADCNRQPYAYIQFFSAADARRALKELNGVMLYASPLVVQVPEKYYAESGAARVDLRGHARTPGNYTTVNYFDNHQRAALHHNPRSVSMDMGFPESRVPGLNFPRHQPGPSRMEGSMRDELALSVHSGNVANAPVTYSRQDVRSGLQLPPVRMEQATAGREAVRTAEHEVQHTAQNRSSKRRNKNHAARNRSESRNSGAEQPESTGSRSSELPDKRTNPTQKKNQKRGGKGATVSFQSKPDTGSSTGMTEKHVDKNVQHEKPIESTTVISEDSSAKPSASVEGKSEVGSADPIGVEKPVAEAGSGTSDTQATPVKATITELDATPPVGHSPSVRTQKIQERFFTPMGEAMPPVIAVEEATDQSTEKVSVEQTDNPDNGDDSFITAKDEQEELRPVSPKPEKRQEIATPVELEPVPSESATFSAPTEEADVDPTDVERELVETFGQPIKSWADDSTESAQKDPLTEKAQSTGEASSTGAPEETHVEGESSTEPKKPAQPGPKQTESLYPFARTKKGSKKKPQTPKKQEGKGKKKSGQGDKGGTSGQGQGSPHSTAQ